VERRLRRKVKAGGGDACACCSAHRPLRLPLERQDHDRRFLPRSELRVGIVKVAERVPKADKLLRLEIDIGTESPSGLGRKSPKAYRPEDATLRRKVDRRQPAPRKCEGWNSEWDDCWLHSLRAGSRWRRAFWRMFRWS